MKKPMVSLIIPLYNAEDYIDNCISCIKQQTYEDIEVIFINDGSTDNTAIVCEEKMKNLTNAQLISMDNQGVSAARNIGMANASGDYFVFADADDYFFDDYIEYLVNLIMKYDADLAMCDYRKQKASESKIKKISKKTYEKSYTAVKALENVSYRKELSGSPYGKIISRKVAGSIRFNEKVYYYEDYLYVCDAIMHSNITAFGNGVKYLYLQHAKSSTHKFDCEKCIKSWNEFMVCVDHFEELYPEIQGGFQSKALAVSLDMLRKIYKKGYDETLIRQYIQKNSLSVAKDKKCTKLKRMLAVCSSINIDFTINFGEMVLKVLKHIGCEL